MPALIPMAQDEDSELRISYREDPESLNGNDIYMVGPNDGRSLLMALYDKPNVPRDDTMTSSIDFYAMSRKGPSIMENLISMGYDPKTLVISIRKQGAEFEQEKKATHNDVSSLLERLKALTQSMESYETAKGVAIFDEDTTLDMVDEIKGIIEIVKRLA